MVQRFDRGDIITWTIHKKVQADYVKYIIDDNSLHPGFCMTTSCNISSPSGNPVLKRRLFSSSYLPRAMQHPRWQRNCLTTKNNHPYSRDRGPTKRATSFRAVYGLTLVNKHAGD
jgi:hypothetical protein